MTLHHEPSPDRGSAEATPADNRVPDGAGDAAPPRTGRRHVSRRAVLQTGAGGAALATAYAVHSMLGPSLAQRGLASSEGVFDAASIELSSSLYSEVFPISPLVLEPFKDQLPIPAVLQPTSGLPGAGRYTQSSLTKKDGTAQAHQCWSDDDRIKKSNNNQPYPEPVQYQLDIKIAEHSFTSSKVLPIDAFGKPTASVDRDGRT